MIINLNNNKKNIPIKIRAKKKIQIRNSHLNEFRKNYTLMQMNKIKNESHKTTEEI